MKVYHINTILFFILLTLFYSCKKDFLNIDPKGKLVAQTAADYNLLLNANTYSLIKTYGHVYLGDEITAIETYYNVLNNNSTIKRYYPYQAKNYEGNENGYEVNELLKQLYNFNKIINEVMDAAGNEQDKASYRAEALTNRAWVYFMLINYYGKPYNKVTSDTDPGFPIITAADLTQTKFNRASVAEVYNFIINDLKAAIPDLAISKPVRVRTTKSAAEALLAKVYLFMGKYDEALVQLNYAFEHLPTAFNVALIDYNSVFAPGGSWNYSSFSQMSGIAGESNNFNNTEVLFLKQMTSFDTYMNSSILLSPSAYKLYESGDYRLKLYSPLAFLGAPLVTPGVYRKIGTLLVQVGITLPDMYLISAELKARTGDLDGAKTDIETLRKKRMPAEKASVNVNNANAMIKFVIDERIREFAMQGYRWFDMRRLSTDPLFSGASYTHQVLSKTGTVVASFHLSNDRLTLQIPENIILANPGMVNNP